MDEFTFFQPACLTVTDITRYLRQLLEGDEILQELWVEGEISNLSRPSSGHCYFTLKDSGAALRCVIWRSTAARLHTPLQEGASIQAHGSIGVYEPQGSYQLYVDQVRPAGEGALYKQFIQLKDRLEAQGLFDADRKRPMPLWPRRIGVVTSPTGAALQDVLNCIRRRFPLADVILSPAPVQGTEAPQLLIQALEAVNRLAAPDVILLVRGGGSLEDLWAFNDEALAYAIAASQAPVVSGIGHETDFTIADFVADLRAPTPTAAAELSTPEKEELLSGLAEMQAALGSRLLTILADQRWLVKNTHSRLGYASPARQIRSRQQQVDDYSRLLERLILHQVELNGARLVGVRAHLSALDPYAVFDRGYAMVTRQDDGRLVRSVQQVQTADEVQIRLADGSLGATINSKVAPAKAGGAASQPVKETT